MKKSFFHSVREGLSIMSMALILSIVYVSSAFFSAEKVEAGTAQNISGWAWSDTAGWISFNNTSDGSTSSYGVNVSTVNKSTGGKGDFTGYAWSQNVGWVSFERSSAGNPPSAPFNGGSGPIAQVDWSTGKVTGWARVLSYASGTSGWDGWVMLSDDTNPSWAGKGVKITGNKLSGFAWGANPAATTGIGWVDFSPSVMGVPLGVQIAAPTCDKADPTITWGSCQPVATCTAGQAGTTLSNQSGVAVGSCGTGGTVTVDCTTATLVCPASGTGGAGGTGTSTTGASVKTRFWQF